MRKSVRSALLLALPLLITAVGPARAAPTAVGPARAAPTVVGPAQAAAAGQKLVTGRLANGLRFAILPRQNAEPGAGLLMRNEGGFIAERRPGERGLAHLIEHVVFRSPTTGAPDDLGHFTRLGLPLTYPAAHVATTTWRESNWFLSSRTRQAGDLDRIIGLFREAAGDLTFRGDAVDIERQSVMREMADKMVGNRIYGDYIAALAPGSPNDVIAAQNSDDVPTASLATLRALYHRLYRPEAMMIVVVGDVDPGQVKQSIEKRFGDWKPQGPPTARARAPLFRRDRIQPFSYSAYPQGRRTAVLGVVLPTPAPRSRAAQARATLMDLIAVQAVGGRLAAAQPGSPPGMTGLYIENSEPGHRQVELWSGFTGDQWRPAVTALRRVTCTLATGGFAPAEWQAARARVVADLEQRAATMDRVANVDLAKDLSHALADGRDLIQPDEMLLLARTILPAVDAKAGSRWWHRQWRSGTPHLRVEAPDLARSPDPIGDIRATAGTGCAL